MPLALQSESVDRRTARCLPVFNSGGWPASFSRPAIGRVIRCAPTDRPCGQSGRRIRVSQPSPFPAQSYRLHHVRAPRRYPFHVSHPRRRGDSLIHSTTRLTADGQIGARRLQILHQESGHLPLTPARSPHFHLGGDHVAAGVLQRPGGAAVRVTLHQQFVNAANEIVE